jgi:hypothetical protein
VGADDRLLAARAGGDEGDGGFDLLLDEIDVVPRFLRQAFPVEDADGGALPPLESAQHRLGGLQGAAVGGEGVQGVAVELVGDADRDLVDVL